MASYFFTVLIHGQLESVQMLDHDHLYCKYSFVYGSDWMVLSGIEEGVTQMALKQEHNQVAIWSFPLEISFKSTNVFGWPQILVCVYGLDGFGRDVIRGYGSIHLPRIPGRVSQYIPLFVPLATSKLNGFLSWVTGRLPEFFNPLFITKGEGREVTRVSSGGIIKLTLQVITRDMEKFGFTSSKASPAFSIFYPGAPPSSS